MSTENKHSKSSRSALLAGNSPVRYLSLSLIASLLISASPVALHAETSTAELAKEIAELKARDAKEMAELKAQIRSMRSALSEPRARKSNANRNVASVPAGPPPILTGLTPAMVPVGSTAVSVNATKQMQYGPLTITPGGFIEAAGIYRTKSLQSDIASVQSNVPFASSPLYHIGEGRVSVRATRAALLAEAAITPTYLLSGYVEGDLQGAGTTSNNNMTNSYYPRLRHAYVTLDNFDYGMHVLAGQTWSLIVPNSKGITPRNEVLPPNIDQNDLIGYEYGRQPQIRLVKDFDRKLWFAISAESPGTVVAGCGLGNVSNTGATVANSSAQATALNPINGNNVTCSTTGGGGNGAYGSAATAQAVTFNQIPDILGKVAYEQRLGDRDIHYEATGIYRNFINNENFGIPGIATPSANRSADGFGIEAALLAPLIPRRLDLQIQGVYGRGLGKYSDLGLPDAAVEANGNLKAVPFASAVLGLIGHVTPAIDLFGYAGFEQVNRTISQNAAGTQFGYGATNVNNTGCSFQGGVCNGQTHRGFEAVVGINDNLYKGAFGQVRVGVNYEYIRRDLFGGNNNGMSAFIAPSANDSIIYTNIRYYPFQ